MPVGKRFYWVVMRMLPAPPGPFNDELRPVYHLPVFNTEEEALAYAHQHEDEDSDVIAIQRDE